MSQLRMKLCSAAGVACATFAALAASAQAQDLKLTVNPFSGVITITNTSTIGPVSIDGYQITSASGQLVPDPSNSPAVGWNSFTDAGLPGWAEYVPSVNALSELNLTNSTLIPLGGSVSLGAAFTPYGTRDIGWGYSQVSGNTSVGTLPGALEYAGGVTLEVITLYGAGHATVSTPVILHNVESAVSIAFDAYSIQSVAGSLNAAGFNGFNGHSVSGWLSVGPAATALSELNLTSQVVMGPNKFQPLGQAFTPDATEDLTLQVRLVGPSINPVDAVVVYRDQLAGDVNRDGLVNGQDIAAIASRWLQVNNIDGEANYDGFVNGQDIAMVASHWLLTANSGAGAGVASVPEPGTMTLLSLGLVAGCFVMKRRKS